jgi:DNA-binding transcriptional ArsR family regulator
MLRMHFTPADVARTRVATTWGPFAEAVLCFGALRTPRLSPPFRPWREATQPVDTRQIELARYLRPIPGTVVDLLTLVGEVDSFDTGAEALAASADADFRTELSMFSPERLPGWLSGLDRAEPRARQLLTRVLSRTHERMIGPFWPSMGSHLTGERARMGRLLLDHGVEHLFHHLHPGIRWRAPVLEVVDGAPCKSRPENVHLKGRGLVIAPSVFCGRIPIPLFPLDGSAALLLVPNPPELADAPAMWNGGSRTGDPLAAVLGRTRAAVLRSLEGGTTTTELARRLGITVSGASQHASALRSAGLVSSRRDRNRMVHATTDLGAKLLDRIG